MRLLLFAVCCTCLVSFISAHKIINADRIIIIRVDEIGMITDGLDTISSEELSEYISKRLFKSYMGNGRMYDRIRLEKINDGPVPAVMEVILKEIALGQKKALTDFCLHKYKKGFDALKSNQQEKIRKQFPVLFQSSYD